MSKLVSVIIPSYNHGQYIENAIDSVLAQDYENFELIIIDDGSTDNSHDVLSKIKKDSRINVILNSENRGQSAVINQALKFARGDFICLLPSDDWYLPKKLTLQVEKFYTCDKDVGVVYGGGLRYFSDTGLMLPVNLPVYKGAILEDLIRQPNFIYPVTPMFRRECFEFAKPDETYKAEGEAIYLKLAIKYKFEYIDDILGVMRDHSYNTGKITKMMYDDNIRYWTDFFSRDDLPKPILELKNIPLARMHRLKGLESIILEKQFASGQAALIKAIALKPSYISDYRVLIGLTLSIIPGFVANAIIDRKKSSDDNQAK
jgi:glycosyltransferase involved in cell wall biosynthesis